MSTSKPGGSGRRRMAGDAARRRREQAGAEPRSDAAATEATTTEADPPKDATADAAESGKSEPGAASSRTSEEMRGDRPEYGGRSPRIRVQAPPRETWWWLSLLGVVTVAALVFVSVVGVRYLQERNDDAALAEGREDATSSAATAAQEILSYDYQSLEADRAAAEKLMTDDFQQEYGALFSKPYCEAFSVEGECTVEGSFPEVVKQNKQQVDASVVDVAPMECGDDCSDTKTQVLMFIDQSSTANGKQQAPVGQRAVFTMVEQDGDWLVDGIAYV